MIQLRFVLLLALSWPACTLAQSSGDRLGFTAAGTFSEDAIRRGVSATREQCAALDDAVWAETADYGSECLRYWTAGFAEAGNRRVIVYFAGDVWAGAGRTDKQYLDLSIDKLRGGATAWAKRLDAPFVFFARPGTYGSSGDHMQRRRIGESKLISAALDQLKARLKIDEYVLVGQSGGGHVVAALLTQRSDIVCAVPTSAPSSPQIRYRLKGLTRDVTGYSDSFEPHEHLDKALAHRDARVFVVGDTTDYNVPWPAQKVLADKLQEAGIAVEVLQGRGAGPVHHSLSDSGRIVAGWCYHDVPTDEIVRRAASGLRG